jgi:ABC-type multidrug transport system ATPase subunit
VSLALLGDPAIVYLDEPTTGKGAKGRDKRRGKQEARKEH